MDMSPEILLDAFIETWEQDSKAGALQAYLERILARANEKPALYALYEPDITNRSLQPSVRAAADDARHAAVDLEAADVNDLGNPLSACYVTRKTQRFDLQGRMLDSAVFRNWRERFGGRWRVCIAPLNLQGNDAPLAVLLVIRPGDAPDEDALWDKKQRLLTLLLKLQREREQRVHNRHALHRQLKQTADTQRRHDRIEQIQNRFIGADPASQKVQRGIATAAQGRLSVLIRGETGCGKDLVATQIHHMSATPNAPFIAVNCAALPTELIEAELFGSKKGAYTGSVADRKGLVEAAQGGILFLDEIGDMPYPLQAVLLRVLNEKSYRRVGETTERKADFRLICASNAPLERMIEQGQFRKDLYYRICQLQLNVPPLREHLQDLPALAAHFTNAYGLETGQYHAPLSQTATDALQTYVWPGNVRELRNLVFTWFAQHAPSEADPDAAFRDFFMEWKRHNGIATKVGNLLDGLIDSADLRQANELFEKRIIAERLKEFSGNREKAAQSLGIPKRTLAYKCKKLHIDSEKAVVPS